MGSRCLHEAARSEQCGWSEDDVRGGFGAWMEEIQQATLGGIQADMRATWTWMSSCPFEGNAPC